MIHAKPIPQRAFYIDDKVSYKAGEWYGHKSAHWVGSKQYYDTEIDESNLHPTYKKHFKDQFAMCNPYPKNISRKQFDYKPGLRETYEDKNQIFEEKKHNFDYQISHSKHEGIVKMFPKLHEKNTQPFQEEYFKNIYGPTSNQVCTQEYLSNRNSLPSLADIKNDYKHGLYVNLYNKNKDKAPPKKVRNIFDSGFQKDYRIGTIKSPNVISHSVDLKKEKQNIESIFPLKNSKRKIYNLEDKRNFIPCISPGDKIYKTSEFEPNYFKESHIPNSNMNINYNRGESKNTLNFYNSIKIKPEVKKKINTEQTTNIKDDKLFVKNLSEWEKGVLKDHEPTYKKEYYSNY